jgi:RHS repeat-associated protein
MLVEDRNGNKINIAYTGVANNKVAFNVTDTLGRTVVSSSGFASPSDTVAVAGLSNPYTVTWGTAAFNFTPAATETGGAKCVFAGTANSVPVIDSIRLPNGQTYQFSYDAIFGQISKITYPTGGYVSYQWGYNPQAAIVYWSSFNGCVAKYDVPAVIKRFISFDGQNIALEQDFSYSTTWNFNKWTSKQTTVTTFDRILGTSFQTIYTYSAVNPGEPFQPLDVLPADYQLPAEQTVVYKSTTGSILKTVTKGWNDAYQLACEVQTLDNGKISGRFYTYGPGTAITDVKEFDFGQLSSASVCQNLATAPAGITPTRETATSFQSFAATPIYPSAPSIFDRPSSVIKYGLGTRVAESDYTYDGPGIAGVTTTEHDDTNYPTTYTNRGNVKTETRLCFVGLTACSNAVSSYTYDETGQVLTLKDPNGNTTTYSYADSYTSGVPPGNTNAYLTEITRPVTNGINHVSDYSYGYGDGQLTLAKDENGQSTTYTYADLLDRLTLITYPAAGGETIYVYNDVEPTPSVTIQKEISAGIFRTTKAVMDGMGHVTQSTLTYGSGNTAIITTAYDGLGRKHTVTNPYFTTGDPTYGVSTFSYDALGRITQVLNPDSTTVNTAYTGQATEVTDEGNGTRSVRRISQTDALGRLSSVCEVSSATLPNGTSATPLACGQDISATGFLTSYSYDALGNLLGVSEGGTGPRSFQFNSLSQPVSATNPEANTAPTGGTVVPTTYVYDLNGNLTQRVSPLPNQQGTAKLTTAYSYDALNRLIQKTYSDGTFTRKYAYDVTSIIMGTENITTANNIGRPSYACSFSPTLNACGVMEVYGYDSMGRENDLYQCTPQNSCSSGMHTSFSYDLIGDNLTANNTWGPASLTYAYPAGQLTQITSSLSDSNHPTTMLSAVTYNALGTVGSATLGNGMSESRGYSSRTWPKSLALSGSGGVYNFALTFAPDGDVVGSTDSVNGNWTYTYDDFNRVLTATKASPSTPYAYDYDRYGNRWHQYLNGTCTAGTTFCLTFDTNNRVSNGAQTYDTAGNVIQDSLHHYYYDAENDLIQIDGTLGACTTATACYVYDANGQRIEKTVSGVTVYFVYDVAGHPAIELNSAGNWDRTEVYAEGHHLATYSNGPSGQTLFDHGDWLGTERVRTNASGIVCESIDSLPFGDGLTTSGSCGDPSPLHFTGKERDIESGLDNFGARYNSSSLGRFMSPDSPSYSNHKNPQSWNLYAYSLNNPVTFRDADGHKIVCANNPQQCQADAAASIGNNQAASNVTIVTTTTRHSFLGIPYTTTQTEIVITGDIDAFRRSSTNAAKLADLVGSDKTVTVYYDKSDKATLTGWDTGNNLMGGSASNPKTGTAVIDPTRAPGVYYDRDAIRNNVPQSNTGEEFAHEVLGHIWGDWFGGEPAGTRGNMRDSIAAEDAVRALDPARGQKGLTTHHNYQEAPEQQGPDE